MASLSSLTATGATGLAIGPNGSTNPVLVADCSVSSAATGLKVTGRAATAGADLTVVSSGTNENLKIDAKGSGTITLGNTSTGAIALARATGVTGAATVTVASATALTVGANGATNPVVQVDSNTASVATGLKVTGAAAAAGLAVAVISSGTDENLTINAKGAGTVTINGTATGKTTIGSNLSVATGKTLSLLDTGTATATAGAATLSKSTGKVTSESITTAAGAAYTLTLTNTQIAAADIVMTNVANGTNSQGIPVIGLVTPGAGSCTIVVHNLHASQAFNGTVVISFMVVKVT